MLGPTPKYAIMKTIRDIQGCHFVQYGLRHDVRQSFPKSDRTYSLKNYDTWEVYVVIEL